MSIKFYTPNHHFIETNIFFSKIYIILLHTYNIIFDSMTPFTVGYEHNGANMKNTTEIVKKYVSLRNRNL